MTARIFSLAALLGCTLLLTACPQQTTISKVQNDPVRYRNKEIGLVGNVTNSFGALNFGAYELSDETGKIWVLTERGVPAKGARVGVAGKYVDGISWGGRKFGSALQETDRRVRDNR